MSLRFDLDLDTTRNLRDPLQLGSESLWVNRNLEKNGGPEALWVTLLYLTLYSMGVRGAGAMWHIIQEWLNNATACATWNAYGVRGPTVVLGGGPPPRVCA